jgi:predicted MFS family arabinose efflux permease
MPAIVVAMFHGTSLTYSLFGASLGLGAVIGGWTSTRYAKRFSTTASVAGGCILFGACLTVFSATHNVYAALPLVFCTNFGFIVVSSVNRAHIQVNADRRFLGRTTSLNMMAFLGGISFGNVAIGRLAQAVGLPLALCTCGMMMVAIGVSVLTIPALRKSLGSKNSGSESL